MANSRLPAVSHKPGSQLMLAENRWIAGQALGALRFGVRATVGIAAWAEDHALHLLRDRLEAVAPAEPRVIPARPAVDAQPLGDKMRNLLTRALDQSTSDGQWELFHRMLDQLVPDEARVLAALSDGSVSPLVSVYTRTMAGGRGRPALENASLVGRTAHLALPRLTDSYVTHLITLGLVEKGPEDPNLGADYEILLAETHILRAVRQASRGPLSARVDRETLQLSALGAALWDAAQEQDS